MADFGEYQILHHLVRLNIDNDIPFPKEKSQVWCGGPMARGGYSGEEVQSFPAPVPGRVQDLLVQGPHCTGVSRSLHPWGQGLVRGALVNLPQSTQQEGEQTVLGLGFTILGQFHVV